MREIEIIKRKKPVVKRVRDEDNDAYIQDVNGFWCCADDEYVIDGELYRKAYKEIEVATYEVYCPLCNTFFEGSSYLKEVLSQNEKTLWFANSITHYRHSHIKSYDKVWSRDGYGSRFLREDTYETEKHKVNERAIRQYFRKAASFFKKIGFSLDDLMLLEKNEEETIQVFKKNLLILK